MEGMDGRWMEGMDDVEYEGVMISAETGIRGGGGGI